MASRPEPPLNYRKPRPLEYADLDALEAVDASVARQHNFSPVMTRARDWLSVASPREPGWVLIRDLAAENDRLYHALEVLSTWPLERSRFEAEKFAKEALDQ